MYLRNAPNNLKANLLLVIYIITYNHKDCFFSDVNKISNTYLLSLNVKLKNILPLIIGESSVYDIHLLN